MHLSKPGAVSVGFMPSGFQRLKIMPLTVKVLKGRRDKHR